MGRFFPTYPRNLPRFLQPSYFPFIAILSEFPPFFRYQLLQISIVISCLSEFNSLARVAMKLVELKAQLYIDSDGSQMVYNDLLYIDVFKSIGIADQLRFIFDSLKICLKCGFCGGRSPEIHSKFYLEILLLILIR